MRLVIIVRGLEWREGHGGGNTETYSIEVKEEISWRSSG